MTIHLIVYLPDIFHHIWHPTSVCLANTNMSHHLGALSAWRIITSQCCSCINNVCKPCMETLSPQTFSQGTCSFQHTKPQTRGFQGSSMIGTLAGGLLRPPSIFAQSEKKVKSALWGFELKSEKILGLENFSCVTAIFLTFFGSSEKKVKKMCVTAA